VGVSEIVVSVYACDNEILCYKGVFNMTRLIDSMGFGLVATSDQRWIGCQSLDCLAVHQEQHLLHLTERSASRTYVLNIRSVFICPSTLNPINNIMSLSADARLHLLNVSSPIYDRIL
jgi:hypothetical protein